MPQQTVNKVYEVDRATSLCLEQDSELNCTTDSYLSVPESTVKTIFYKCLTGRTVNVERKFSNGHVKSINICSSSSNVEFNEFDRSSLENNGDSIHFDPMDNGDYKVTGEGLLQKEHEVCDVSEDCMVNFVCDKNSTAISSCQDICRRKRWAPRKVEECVVSCDHASCLQAAVDEWSDDIICWPFAYKQLSWWQVTVSIETKTKATLENNDLLRVALDE